MDYDTLVVDFRGVGGLIGNTTTFGVREAKDVALAVSYAQRLNLKRPFVLYGVSMGSAAILNAVAQEKVPPDAIILELPFARLLDAVRSRLSFYHRANTLRAALGARNGKGILVQVQRVKGGDDFVPLKSVSTADERR